MALRMLGLNRAADGRWFARKGIPEDVREDYQRLYRTKREAHLKLAADTPKHEAKVRLGEWEAEVETRIATVASPKQCALAHISASIRSTGAKQRSSARTSRFRPKRMAHG
ncbi:hypothetical protein AOQ71_17865 [Bradyrhizobium manausense]|uniref:Uncharacterized protein n=1 Tax=Bradyrhizobium manausense TaxID=989370 RepID=A0A0R3DNC8_9BRAD|nr:hypothetical protein AOQ71_17865 [Bradyrhizobium manausense]